MLSPSSLKSTVTAKFAAKLRESILFKRKLELRSNDASNKKTLISGNFEICFVPFIDRRSSILANARSARSEYDYAQGVQTLSNAIAVAIISQQSAQMTGDWRNSKPQPHSVPSQAIYFCWHQFWWIQRSRPFSKVSELTSTCVSDS